MDDFKEWSKMENEYWLSQYVGADIEKTENGFFINSTDGSVVTSSWFDELHSFLKNLFKEVDFFYAYTIGYPNDELIYFVDFKFNHAIYRYYIKEGDHKVKREFEKLDNFFESGINRIDAMFFDSEESIRSIYKISQAIDQFIFQLPKFRLRILLNQLTIDDNFNLSKYMKEKMR